MSARSIARCAEPILREPASCEPASRELEPASDDELATESLLALRAEGPSEASRRNVLAGLGLESCPRQPERGTSQQRAPSRERTPSRERLGLLTQGLALGLALGLLLVLLRVLTWR